MWKGVKWVGDKVFNAGDYIENGLIHLVGFIPGGVYTTEEMLENKRLARESGEGGGGLSYIVTDPSVFYVP